MDVVLDDSFVAPGHLEIRERLDGRYEVQDLQSINGMVVLPSSEKREWAEVGPEDVVRIGHTQLRIRPRSYKVTAEHPLGKTSAYRRPALFSIFAVLLLVTLAWMQIVETSYGDDKEVMVSIVRMALMAAAVVAGWIAMWSLVGRALGGRANFAAHGIVTMTSVFAALVWVRATEYVSFELDASWLESAGEVGVAVVFAHMLYRHLRLASRADWHMHAALATMVSLVLLGGDSLLMNLKLETQLAAQSHSRMIKAPVFLLAPGVSPEAFLDGTEVLKRDVDAMASE